ncbi:hypothetical protein [Christiangramia echinicola]|uniref:Lipoprotein n=1 Tax=Christiangramia echinicola TaxID=279359 RepID=A0A1H1KV21_9FLAO|nr:hypothetical protein [Christiangramia echinicola]SDR65860.1 hypothetical protein SAMN04488552_0204 [Christiangramia echinicola]
MKIHKTGLILLLILTSCANKNINSRLNSYEIYPSITIEEFNKVQMINELKFKPKNSSLDGIKYMYQNYGKWDNSIDIDRTYPLLIWENIKLIEGDDELYTVGLSGEQSTYTNYCSVIVYNSKNENCFDEKSNIKDALARMFIQRTENISESDKSLEKLISN